LGKTAGWKYYVVDGDPAARLEDALAEAAELREENARLRGLLGLDARHDDGHRHGWAPTLFSQPTDTPEIDEAAPVDGKVHPPCV